MAEKKLSTEQKLDALLKALGANSFEELAANAGEIKAHLAAKKNEEQATKLLEQQEKDETERQRREPHYWLEIQMMPDDVDEKVFVGCAGVNYWISKGVRVPVPASVISVLRNAEVNGYIPVVDEITQTKMLKPVRYKRYPFSVYGRASATAVESWKQEQQRIAQTRERLALRGRQPLPPSEFMPEKDEDEGEEEELTTIPGMAQ